MEVEYVALDALYPVKIRRLADAIDAVIRSITHTALLDVGCGEGMMIARLRELGWDARGIDGSEEAVAKRVSKWVAQGDVTVPWTNWAAGRWPCVSCTEVAEHIPAEHADTLVDNVSKSAIDAIVWSAAPPGQDWPGHVNMQPAAYWLERFQGCGWEASEGLSDWLRREMRSRDAQHAGAAGTFHVLRPRALVPA
jgi:hypothetical protein